MSLILTVLVTLLIFGVLITVHELGHYLVARACGVAILEFSIGMGPKIKSWEGKVNTFSLRALPVGGYVRMVGEPGEDGEELDAECLAACIGRKAINEVHLLKRMMIVLAGPFMNILLAFVFMFALVCSSSAIGSTQIHHLMDTNISGQYGLQAGDIIREINGKAIRCYPDLSYQILSEGAYPTDILVERNGEEVLLKGVCFAHTEEHGIAFGKMDFVVYARAKTPLTLLYESFWQGCSTVYMTLDSLVDTFTGRYGLDAVGGPLAVGEQIGETIEQSDGFADTVRNLGSMTVMLSVSLGICNLLPLPALDGGRFLLYVIEGIRRKPLSRKVENAINAGCMLLLFALMILIFFKDLIHLL